MNFKICADDEMKRFAFHSFPFRILKILVLVVHGYSNGTDTFPNTFPNTFPYTFPKASILYDTEPLQLGSRGIIKQWPFPSCSTIYTSHSGLPNHRWELEQWQMHNQQSPNCARKEETETRCWWRSWLIHGNGRDVRIAKFMLRRSEAASILLAGKVCSLIFFRTFCWEFCEAVLCEICRCGSAFCYGCGSKWVDGHSCCFS